MCRTMQAPAAIDSLTIPAFIPSPAPLAADSHAPSWNPDSVSPSLRPTAAANALQAALKAAVGKFSRGEQRPRHLMLTMRDPSFTTADQVAANAQHGDFIAPDRKRAAR